MSHRQIIFRGLTRRLTTLTMSVTQVRRIRFLHRNGSLTGTIITARSLPLMYLLILSNIIMRPTRGIIAITRRLILNTLNLRHLTITRLRVTTRNTRRGMNSGQRPIEKLMRRTLRNVTMLNGMTHNRTGQNRRHHSRTGVRPMRHTSRCRVRRTMVRRIRLHQLKGRPLRRLGRRPYRRNLRTRSKRHILTRTISNVIRQVALSHTKLLPTNVCNQGVNRRIMTLRPTVTFTSNVTQHRKNFHIITGNWLRRQRRTL